MNASKRKIIGLAVWLPVLLAGGCASLQEQVAQKIEYIIPKEEVSPGEVFQIGFLLPEQVKNGSVRFLDKQYRVYPRRDLAKRTFTAFLPIPAVKPGKYRLECFFSLGKEKKQIEEELSVQVLPDFRKYTTDSVRGLKFNTEQYVKDRTKIQTLLGKSTFVPKEIQDFSLPTGGDIVSTFGTTRQYGNKAEVALEGIEIASVSAAVLDVNAAADGKVLLAEELPMLGKTVLIDHGYTFATLYCHLKDLEVQKEQVVMRGDRLGHVGNTGGAAKDKRLYYQLFVAGTPVDVQRYSKINIFE